MYAKRDQDGKIIAISLQQEPGFSEALDADDPALLAFYAAAGNQGAALSEEAQRLRSSDTELVRVVEDIINLLTDKGIIQFTELPEAAQQKLLQRKSLRRSIKHLDLIDEDDNSSLMP